MGYAMVYDECLRCGYMFGFNPNKVPSFRLESSRWGANVKRPVCEPCIHMINADRKRKGVRQFVIPEDAYTAIEESEL